MNKFTVEAVNNPEVYCLVEPSAEVMAIAEKLSLHYGEVTVRMFARIRRRYKDGKVVSSNPDLHKFYDNPSQQECLEWQCLGCVKD